MPRLPSARDVPNVSPRITSDPGVSAPAQPVDSPMGGAADVLTQVALKQQNRRDTVDRSSRINQYAREADLELRRLNTEADLSDENVLSGYGSFLAERRQKLIEEHGGSKDSIANLTMRLQDVEAAAIGSASGISTKIGREKVVKTFGDSLAPLVQRANQDPSLNNVNQLFTGLETQISDLRGALDPTEEEKLRQTGRQQIAMSAVETLIARGRVDTAESLLRDGNLAQHLTPEVQRDVARRVETIRFARDETTRKIAQAEAVLGRTLKDTERLAIIGLGKENKLIEIGDPTSPTGTRFVFESEAAGKPGVSKNSSMGTIPPGFQLVRDPNNPNATRMVPIPGSPAETEMIQARQKQVERQEQAVTQSRTVIRSVDRAVQMMDNLDFPETLPGSSLARGALKFAGGSVFDVDNELETIKANIGVDSIQQMRAASPTGAALGNSSDRDVAMMQAMKGSLNVRTDPKVLRQNLKDIRELYLNAWFGSPEEIQAAVDDGRMTRQQALQLQKERESVGFDAIGRAIDANAENKKATESKKKKAESEKMSPDSIASMSLQQISALTDEQIDSLDAKQQKALDQRLKALGR